MGGPEALRAWAGPRRVDRTPALAGPSALRESSVIRVAFAGRTSTYDQQDPTLSIPRQLRTCDHALPESAAIIAHFYDIESGRKDLADGATGARTRCSRSPFPATAVSKSSWRRQTGLTAASTSSSVRTSPVSAARTYIATQRSSTAWNRQGCCCWRRTSRPAGSLGRGQRPLHRCSHDGSSRAWPSGTSLEMLEKSWDGFETHTEQGYNVGKPCYGYRAKKIPHPVPAKRAKGIKKTLLEVHPVEGPVVRQGRSAGGLSSGSATRPSPTGSTGPCHQPATNPGRT